MREDLSALPVSSLKGVGAKIAEKLSKIGLNSLYDLLFHLPLRYEDRTCVVPIGSLRPGQKALIDVHVELTDVLFRGRRSMSCRVSDGSGFLTLRFFHFSASQRKGLERGQRLCCFGEIRAGNSGYEMIHPEYQQLDEEAAPPVENALTPVYPLTEGLQQRSLRKLISQVLIKWNTLKSDASNKGLQELIPKLFLNRMAFPTLDESLKFLHSPSPDISIERFEAGHLPQQQRLAFEELIAHHLSLSRLRHLAQQQKAPVLKSTKALSTDFLERLTFSLTNAQQRVISEVSENLASGRPMMRLVQGDVGSGKTVVAAMGALSALENDYQVALMAPTELLAEQHHQNFLDWFEPLGQKVVFLTGRQKGKVRKEALGMIGNGQAGVIIGTHALFQESVEFSKLGLVIIDEQHRFGVHQRLALRDKGKKGGRQPHQLVMTATPIPRTLAMMSYADLDLSVIDELPLGRTPVVTSVVSSERRAEVVERISGWVENGRQVYWVCTLIEESELLQCEAAEESEKMLKEALPGVRIALVHGRMKPDEKNSVMQSFKAHEIDLLVATTVIEVGVDVPNAGLMVIENAERLGLSQLHQLRGRVGRGVGDSYCLLMYRAPLSETSSYRLSILRKSSDGFYIAEQDLKLRGPGEVLGTRQTGQLQFRIADLIRDESLLPSVVEAAELIQRKYPERVQPIIQRWLGESVNYGEV
jgi:ATP-dependent DNA helicase RecG